MKEFITPETIRDEALKLAHRMYSQDHFVPDVIYVSLRGGVYMGNVMSEYYKIVRAKEGKRPVFYAAVVARSYSDIRCQTRVMVDGWTYSPDYLRSGDRVLIVDDIFDTGKTVNALTDVILNKGIPRSLTTRSPCTRSSRPCRFSRTTGAASTSWKAPTRTTGSITSATSLSA